MRDDTAGFPTAQEEQLEMPNLSPSKEGREGEKELSNTKEQGVTSTHHQARAGCVPMHAFTKRNKMCHFRLDKFNITN